jgi:predicted nucleic acid-binding protein
VILDTNALSSMADGDPKLEPLLRRATTLAVPVIVLGAFRYGIRHSRHRLRYERWLNELIASCRMVAVDEETAGEYAEVRRESRRSGNPIPSNDAWIASLARQHSLLLLSRDRHFDFVPKLKRLDWQNSPPWTVYSTSPPARRRSHVLRFRCSTGVTCRHIGR